MNHIAIREAGLRAVRLMPSLLFSLALVGGSAGCPSGDPGKDAPSEPVVGGKVEPAPAPSGVTRRERSGIDLGERTERPGAASVVDKSAGIKIPPMGQTPSHERSAAALQFLRERWQPAITSRDMSVVAPLLAPGFKAILPGSDEPADAAAWMKSQPSGRRLLGPVEAYPSPGPDGRVTLRFFEQHMGDACQVVSRELTLLKAPEPATGFLVSVASNLSPGPCRTPDGAGEDPTLAAAHASLAGARGGVDAKIWDEVLTSRVSLREDGFTTAVMDRAVLVSGKGQWLIAALGTGAQTTTHFAGPHGWVTVPGVGSYIYRWEAERWKLAAVERAGVPSPTEPSAPGGDQPSPAPPSP